MTGDEKIQDAFRIARSQDRAALILYYTLGYPDMASSLEVVRAAADAGADIIELGIPFSDPLADGPTIQYSTQVALEKGISVRRCLEMTRELRSGGLTLPLIFMGYVNPILAYGLERFVTDARAAGVDGLIVPDMPPEESSGLESACREQDLALVYLLSPASPSERIELVSARGSGFLYLLALNGVTGVRENLAPGLPEFVARVRRHAKTPVALGFGISTPEQAANAGGIADGVIVGSALINEVRNAASSAVTPAEAARAFVSELRAGMGGSNPA